MVPSCHLSAVSNSVKPARADIMPYQGDLAQTPSHLSPVLVDTVARPRRTCPGFCRVPPDCSGMLPCQDDLAPTPSLLSPVLVDTVARPRRTCPGCRRAQPDCSGMLPYQDDLAPTPSLLSPVLVDTVARPRHTCPGFVERCQIVQGCCRIRMIWPQHLLSYRQCSLIQWLGLVVLALAL